MTMVTKVILKANTSQIKPVARTGSILIMIMTMYLFHGISIGQTKSMKHHTVCSQKQYGFKSQYQT
jgi:hypothetical protein